MTRLEFLKLGFKHRLYQKKIWLLSVFSVLIDTPANKAKLNTLAGTIHRSEDQIWFIHPETNERHDINDSDYNRPLFYKHDKIVIDDSFYPGVKSGLETTAGIYLVNQILFNEVFQDRVKYINGLIEDSHIKRIISALMVDNPKEGETIPADKASVDECLRLTKQLNYLEGLNEVFVKSGSVQALDVNDKVIALREQLFEKYKDQLDDAVVVAKIIKEVVDADIEDQMNGASADFYIDKKFIDNARKKMFLVFGLERDFTTGDFRLIKNPLNENWDPTMITHYVNTAISASYDRGKSTGEGGADVNALIRLTSRIRVTEFDCGSTSLENITLTWDIIKDWIGSNYVVNGKLMKITEGDIVSLTNKTVAMRVPQFCSTKDGNFCKTCVGDKLGFTPNAISAELPMIATVFMLIKMKNAHVSKTDIIDLKLEDLLQ